MAKQGHGDFPPSQRSQLIWKESSGPAQAQSGAFGGLKSMFDSDLASLQTHSFGILWMKAVGAQKVELKHSWAQLCAETQSVLGCAGWSRNI